MGQRPAKLFALLPASILLAFVSPIIVGAKTWYLRDLFSYHLGVKIEQARAMREGVLPLVDPLRASGQALIANLNNVALYPDNLLYLVAPAIWAFNTHLWLHLLLAPLTLYWLARSIGLEREAAWAAGFCYALSGFFLSQLNLYNLVAGAALAPAFGAACIAATSGRRRAPSAAAAGALLALVSIAGDPIVAAITLALGLAAIFVVPDWDRRALPRLALALALGALVAAPQVEEFLRILPTSYRGSLGLETESRLSASWDPRTAIDLVVPFFYGPPDQRYWGEPVLHLARPLYMSLYPGLLAIALVVAAGRPRTRAQRWAWWMVLAGGFFALGGWNPVMFYLYRLPQAASLRYPIKAWIVLAIGASLLAGMGFERAFLGGRRRALVVVLVVLGAGAAAGTTAIALAFPRVVATLRAWIAKGFPDSLAVEEAARWRAALLVSLATVALGLALVLMSRRSPRVAGALFLALHVGSQLVLLQPLLDTDDVAAYRAPPPALAYIEPGERIAHGCLIGVACDLGGPGKYPDWRMSWIYRRGWLELYPFAAATFGLRCAYDVSPEGLDTVLVFAAERALRGGHDTDALRLLQAAAVDVILVGRSLEPAAESMVHLRARLPSVGGEVWIYGIEHSAPEARLAHRVHGGDTRRILLEMLDPGFDPARDAFLPGRPAGVVERGGGAATIESESRERLRIRTESEGPGLLVLGRAWLPHYRARIDDAPAATLQAGFGQLAVEVPDGSHVVDLAVDRRPWNAALAVCGVGLLGLAALAVAGTRRERRQAAACQPPVRVGESAG